MNEKQIEYFWTVLNNRLDELLNQAGNVMSELVSQNSKEIEFGDQASVSTNQELRLKIRSRERRLIKKIRQALKRFENNTYGICELCEEDISIRRLDARPVTTKCIHCKEEEERQELLMQ
jgi:DnaK suppressor protein